jgi:hypothetical protein
MRKHHSWPEGSDDEALHVGLIISFAGQRQLVCCCEKMSRLGQRKWRRGPSLDLDQFLGWAKTIRMLLYEDVSVGPKEGMAQSFTWFWSVPWVGQDKLYVAMQRCLSWPKGSDDVILHMCCYESRHRAKMTRLVRRKSLGRPRRCYNVDERTKALSWVNSLTPWLSGWTNTLGKNPLFWDKTKDNG